MGNQLTLVYLDSCIKCP